MRETIQPMKPKEADNHRPKVSMGYTGCITSLTFYWRPSSIYFTTAIIRKAILTGFHSLPVVFYRIKKYIVIYINVGGNRFSYFKCIQHKM